MRGEQPTLLVISQVYPPDPASVGQHIHDVAVEMARRGYPVRVLAAARGYENPRRRFSSRECIEGVDVQRLPLSSFGKRSLRVRLAAQVSFLFQAALRASLLRRAGVILVSTSPPMASAAALVITAVRRVPIVYWVMDVNPDQAVALGVVRPGSPLVWLFERLNQAILRRAQSVVTLDRFMAARLREKVDIDRKLDVFPPWPHDDRLAIVAHDENPFRAKHGLGGKFVVMYSGNHSPSNPIDTLVEAARRLHDRPDIAFVFIGGGAGKQRVADAVRLGARNIIELPYQPLSEIKYSLSAADLHVVSVGAKSVGIVHPCKVYGAMAVARPVLVLGPERSHVADLLDRGGFGRRVEHGDVDGAVAAIEEIARMPRAERQAMGRRGYELVRSQFSKERLCSRLGDLLERALLLPQGTVAPQRREHAESVPRAKPVEQPSKRKAA